MRTSETPECPCLSDKINTHLMVFGIGPKATYTCSRCNTSREARFGKWKCETCGNDCCLKCKKPPLSVELGQQCPNGHTLHYQRKLSNYAGNRAQCDGWKHFVQKAPVEFLLVFGAYTCRMDNYDLCWECHTPTATDIADLECPKGHKLGREKRRNFKCDICSASVKQEGFCFACPDYIICNKHKEYNKNIEEIESDENLGLLSRRRLPPEDLHKGMIMDKPLCWYCKNVVEYTFMPCGDPVVCSNCYETHYSNQNQVCPKCQSRIESGCLIAQFST